MECATPSDAIFGWIAFVLVTVALGSMIGTRQLDNNNNGVGESGRADQILNAKFPQTAGEQVLVQSGKLTISDPQFQSAVRDVVGALSGTRTVEDLRSPLAPANSGEVSHDGHSALVGFQIAGDQSHADKRVGASLAATAAAQRAHPGLTIEQAGDASADKALNKSFSDDFAKARTLSLPITLVILIFAFGALVAAGIPVLLAITGVGATLGLVALVSRSSRSTRPCPRWCCWSGWRSASTTRCSTCAASARSGLPDAASRQRWRRRRRPRAARCWSRA